MNKTQLRMNRFAESILSEYKLFSFNFIGKPIQAYANNQSKSNVLKIRFEWSWNDYSGYGDIYFDKDTKLLCNELGEDFSYMTVASDSKRQQPNGRGECALYNDPLLADLFSKMLLKLSEY